MAIATITVSGVLVDPTGATAVGGSIGVELDAFAKVEDAGVSQRVAGTLSAVVGTDGSVSIDLVPCDLLTPSSARYRVALEANGRRWSEVWNIQSTDANPLDVGDVTRE